MRKLNRGLIFGLVALAIVSIPVVISFFWHPYDVNSMDYESVFLKPSIYHLFGTDNYGRDIFCRVVEGIKATMLIAVFTVLVGGAIGCVIGALTGYFGGFIDEILMRVNDGLASFPSILLALVVVSVLDKGTLNICIALAIVFIPSFARIMRAEYIKQRNMDYVYNARIMGASDLRIMVVHIFPNTLPVLKSTVLVGLNNAILAEAGLSYLGLGVLPPDPSLGRMLSEAQVYIFGAPWYVLLTSLAMILIILGMTLVSENIGLRASTFRKIKKIADRQRIEAQKNSAEKESSEDNSIEKGLTDEAVLKVENLHVGFISDDSTKDNPDIREVICGIDFSLAKGEILGIVGESGSGKSMTALSIMGIAPEDSVITEGRIFYGETELSALSENEYVKYRGEKLAMIFQEPMTSLNPLLTVGEQIDEVLDLHAAYLTAGQQRSRVICAMEDVGLENPDELYNKYPHELSGGMRQRVMIAMALVAHAEVIIADEPTTALDADIAHVILDIFKKVNKKYGTSVILISHDLEVISSICDRALVMKDGAFIEQIKISEGSFSEPVSDYGKALLKAAYADTSYLEADRTDADESSETDGTNGGRTLVHLSDYNVYYKDATAGRLFGRKLVRINKDICLDIYQGDCVGFVGPSGCGKSTLVKGIAGLQRYTDGVCALSTPTPAFVFQDPMSSLNPAMRVGRILEEPLRLNKVRDKEEKKKRIAEVLDAVELDETLVERQVWELSGGQRQRISIALSILLNRELIILDEPVSALDVTIREQIVELLMRLKKERGLTFIVISHDRRLVSRICNRVFSLEDGHALEVH